MKKLLSLTLAAFMLTTSAMPVFADEAPAGLTLAEGSHLRLDSEKMYVDGIDGTITVGELKANFTGDVSVAGKSDDAAVATDDVIGEYKALIYGDVNRDGKVNLSDVSGVLQNIAGWAVNVNADAADVNKTGDVTLTDVTKLLKSIAGWADISLGNVRLVYENKAEVAENEDSTLNLQFVDMMFKHGRDISAYPHEYAHKMKLAKNEDESCQALLVSSADREGLSAELTEFVSEYGDATMEGKLEWVNYYDHSIAWPIIKNDVTKNKGYWENNDEYVTWTGAAIPEVVLEMADSFELEANLVQHLIVTVKSTKDTPAGMYTASLNIKDADGKIIKTSTVYAYVWDFTLPDEPYSASLFSAHHNKENYDFMLDYNICDYILPYEITDERADAYMSDPRVTAFVIAGGATGPNGEYGTPMYGGCMDESIEDTVANYNKVASNPEWFNKGVFYYTDEPWGPHLDNLKNTYLYITDLLGTTNIRNMTPLAGNDGNFNDYCAKNNCDPVEYIKDYINVWCPQSPAFHRLAEGGLWTLRRFVNIYGEFPERAEKFRERGDTIWWYVCCSPEIPYANYFTWYQGVVVRLLSWQQYFNDVDGVLYYRTLGGDITKYKFNIYNGDGVLQYEGYYWGRDGYAASWRLLQIRDGFDDFDYLRMAEELCGREAVMEVVNRVTSGMLRYTEDYRVLDAARDEIVNMILDAQAK